MANKWKVNDRIALQSDLKYKGLISQVMPLYDTKDRQMFNVKWDNGTTAIYYDDLFVSEKEANELLKAEEKEKPATTKKSKKNTDKSKS